MVGLSDGKGRLDNWVNLTAESGSNNSIPLLQLHLSLINNADLDSGCGPGGRAVASNTRDPRFESQHQQNVIYPLTYVIRKDKEKEKESGNSPSSKRIDWGHSQITTIGLENV